MRFTYSVLCALLLVVQSATADINQHFESIRNNPKALYAFFKKMPKGGELHYHLAGGASPETMLKLAPLGNYCVDKISHTLSKTKTHCSDLPLKKLSPKSALYREILNAWSLQDFKPGIESQHDHFFASFFKFQALVADFSPQLLASVIQHAAEQQALYLEVMVLPDNAYATTFAPLIHKASTLEIKKKILLNNPAYQKNIKHTVDESRHFIQDARKSLGCVKKPLTAACNVTVKLQYIILREQPIDNLFAQALNGFAAASQSSDLVSINLVQAEDGPISLQDYRKQMGIISFLHEAYPKTHITLHAGELSKHKVSQSTLDPKELRYHIHDALYTGHAERIGHGTDIIHEKNKEKVLSFMKKNSIPVEINLTSNQRLLAVSDKENPLRYYLKHNVPVVLSTDDEGILRTDLSQEYVEAALKHKLDYATLKTINRNAITYSFLPGKSIWKNAQKGIRVNACRHLDSKRCQRFIKQSEKATLQRQLEKNLLAFEKQYEYPKRWRFIDWIKQK